MDREFFLQSIEDSLEAAGFSVDDLVQYCAEESPSLEVCFYCAEESPSSGSFFEEKSPSSGSFFEEFPFEVMYEGMVRSWSPLKGKRPLGVIFEKYLVRLHDSLVVMAWNDAMKYCKEIQIDDCACDAGEIEFWRKLSKLSEQEKQAFDQLMVQLGGEPIALSKKMYWSSSYGGNYYAVYPFGDGIYDDSYGDPNYYVRPVLFLD